MKTITNLLETAARRMRSKELPRAVSAAGNALAPSNTSVDVHWLTLNQLPGWMLTAVRAMGESIFSPLTTTRLQDIEVIGNLAGLGPHSQQSIDITTHWLRRTTRPSNILEYSTDQIKRLFGASYQAQAILFEGSEYTYLLVRDRMGRYIYRWPFSDTKTRLIRSNSRVALPLDRDEFDAR